MKKKILYTTMFSILSFAAHADNTEAELKKMLLQLSPDSVAEKTDLKFSKEEKVVSFKPELKIETNKVLEKNLIINKKEYVSKKEEVNTFQPEDPEEVNTVIIPMSDEENHVTNLNSNQFEENLKINNEIPSHDHVYLLNIPVQTEIKPNEDLYIYPYRGSIIYDDGKLISSSPLKFTDKTTFCYFLVEKSGSVRRLKSDSPTQLYITGNKSIKGSFSSNLNPKETLFKYETTFSLNNEHLKAIRCISTENKLPLTIEDFNRETGNRFNFIFPSIVDIQ